MSTWCSFLEEAVPRLLPGLGEPRSLEESMINCVLNLVACLWQVSSLTVFFWMRLIFLSFDFACLRDVPFRKRLLRSPSQEWVNPGGWSSQWLAPFWLFEFAVNFSSVTVFFWMRLFFDPFDFWCLRDVPFWNRLFRGSPGIGELRWLEQSMISSVLTLWVCRGLLLSVTAFIWLPLFFDPFDFRCLRDVPFWKRLFRSSS